MFCCFFTLSYHQTSVKAVEHIQDAMELIVLDVALPPHVQIHNLLVMLVFYYGYVMDKIHVHALLHGRVNNAKE